MRALVRAALWVAAASVAPWTSRAQTVTPDDARRREDFARARACIAQASSLSAHERAEHFAACAEALSPYLAPQRASFAALAAAAYRDDHAPAPSVRWASRCYRDAALAPSPERASALRRECATMIREQFRSVAWIKSDDDRCEWSAREDRSGDGALSQPIPIARDGVWTAVQPGRAQLDATCDRIPHHALNEPPHVTVTTTLRAAVRYRITRTAAQVAR